MKTSVTKKYRFSAGSLSLTFLRTEEGLSLGGIADSDAGTVFFSGRSPLFSLKIRRLTDGSESVLASDAGWQAASVSLTDSSALLAFEKHAAYPGLAVYLEASAARAHRIAWSVRILNEHPGVTAVECDYPVLTFTSSPEREVFFPYGCGEVYSSSQPFRTMQNYPSYGVSMQYMAFWDKSSGTGIYYGLHDPAPAYKRLFYVKEPNARNAYIKASMPLRDIGLPSNSQYLEGLLVWELFRGDWFDAANIYKSFVLRNASWIPDCKDGKRIDTPDWLRTNPHWWRKRIRETDGFAEELLSASKDLALSAPSPVHLYDWHRIPYDTNYPHYFPAKSCSVAGMKRLHEGGMRYMPYINGRLWDTHDRGTEDWQFTSVAKPYCTKNSCGDPFIEVYPTSGVEQAIMCPSTALWQEKQKEIVRTLFAELDVDGVYIDQIGAAQPYPCEDRSHHHRPGGGTWWVESYRNLIDHVRLSMPEGGFLTTECTSEPYMKNIQGFLTWIWIKNNQVPAFTAVYNGLVVLFGRNYASAPTAVGQNILAAQSLTFGEQMGWIHPEVYRRLKNRLFYKKCVRCREQIGSYIYDGRLMRSPSVTGSGMLRTRHITIEAYGGKLAHTAAFSELWERKDGRKLLFLINASANPDRPTIVSSDIPDGIYTPYGDLRIPVECKGGSCTPELPPFSVSYLLIG